MLRDFRNRQIGGELAVVFLEFFDRVHGVRQAHQVSNCRGRLWIFVESICQADA